MAAGGEVLRGSGRRMKNWSKAKIPVEVPAKEDLIDTPAGDSAAPSMTPLI